MVAKAQDDLWERLVDASWSDLDPQAAQGILRIRFGPSDISRMNELAALARDGALSSGQQDELDEYTRVGRMLAVLQSKARLALAAASSR